MALSSVTITGDLSNMLGVDFDPTVTRISVYTNVESDTVIDTVGNTIRLGSGVVALASDGTFSASVWVPGTGSNPDSWQTYFRVEYRDPGSRGRATRTFGPFTITAAADLADLVEEQEVPAEYLTTVTALLDGYVTEAEAARDETQALRDGIVGDLGTTDSQTATLINTPSSLTASSLSASYAQVVHRPINVAEAYGRTDTPVREALADALAGPRSLYFPAGPYSVTGDLVVDVDKLAIAGDGDLSLLTLTDGALKFDGSTGYLLRPTLRDMKIARVGTAGPAIHAVGAGSGSGAARLYLENVEASSQNGEALLYEASYIATLVGCYFTESVYGIRGQTAAGIGQNCLEFIGGESYGNDHGWEFDTPSGVTFIGFTTEGNSLSGGKVTGIVRGFTYLGGYFELNNGPDIEIDGASGSGAVVIQGNIFYCTGATKTEAILLRRGNSIGIRDNHAVGLVQADGDVFIRVSETTTQAVNGEQRNNTRSDNGTIVSYSAGTPFNMTQVGQVTKAATNTTLTDAGMIRNLFTGTAVLDFGSIAAGATAELTITVTGCASGDDATAHPNSLPESGLSWNAVVTGANTVTVRLANNTGSAIDPVARTWRVRVWR